MRMAFVKLLRHMETYNSDKLLKFNILSPIIYTTYLMLYAYRFSRDVIFSDDQNQGFSWFYFRGLFVINP